MKYEDLLILLPCHSLEDFPTHHQGDDAAGLLAGWSALWHPALLASSGSMPSWFRADSPPPDLSERLIVVPGLSEAELPTGFAERAADAGACLIRGQTDRRAILDQALSQLDEAPLADPDLAADFLALGYCYLQIQLLTRQMRYSSNLDEIHFQNQLVGAASATMEGDLESARQQLAKCFDMLAEERDHYYPVDACILDLTMVAASTIGRSLQEQLDSEIPANLLLCGEVLERIAGQEPATMAALQRGLAENRLGLIGGEYSERRLPLLSCETLRHQLLRGLSCYESLLGRRPEVYGRWRYGWTPLLPQVLRGCGFVGALHAALEEGTIPEGTQIKVRWEGWDGTALDAIARPPLDANRPGSYLNYAIKMGESMDMDHVATICLAHWPGQISPWYEDLRRISRYGSALGKFTTIEAYFRDTDVPAHQDRFRVDQYRSPYLKQAVVKQQPDPLSSCVRYWRQRELAESAHTLDTLTQLVRGTAAVPDWPSGASPAEMLERVDAAGDDPPSADSGDELCRATRQQAAERFADCLPRAASKSENGYLVFNPHSFVRRVGVEMPRLEHLPAVGRPVYATAAGAKSKYVVVDVPALGFVWVSGTAAAARAAKASPPMAEQCLLRNEFFEVLVDPATGGLRAIREYNSRNNRISQQLAMRLAAPPKRKSGAALEDADVAELYSLMTADSVETTVSTPVLGEIVARGRLRDRKGKDLATFQQTFRLWRGSRVLQLDIDLEPLAACEPDAANSYYAARFAWANEAAELHRSVNMTRHPTTAKRFESPLYVELDDGSARTTLLTGGLPFHRKPGPRMLDSLLVVQGESCRSFRMGIGVELKNPLHEALSLQAPVDAVFQSAAPPASSRSGWLFHIDARNIAATHWEPLREGGEVKGFRVRLLETLGRSAKVTLSGFRSIGKARQIRPDGSPSNDCTLAEGRVQLQMAAYAWTEIEAWWE